MSHLVFPKEVDIPHIFIERGNIKVPHQGELCRRWPRLRGHG